MQQHTSAPQGISSPGNNPPEPPVSHRGAVAASVVLLALWAVATFGAVPVTAFIAATAEQVEVALGLDLAKGAPPEEETEKK